MKKILIGASVAALLLIGVPVAAPRLVNWNDYRDELAARVGGAIGQSVRFDGDLGLQLLPAPAFTAQNVRIKAPPGFTQEDMATIKHLEVRIALSPLLSGRIAVESLAVAEPTVVVESDAAGRINWRAAARRNDGGDAPGAVGPLGQLFSFDQILLRDGSLTLIDSRSGLREALTKIDLKITAGSLTGPFQIAGGV
ncbi:MAG TPA: AsmA family protein, partial [Azospirillaceae bacterium]|nr:AsmA family protein [Azospirillaceae bacterium]